MKSCVVFIRWVAFHKIVTMFESILDFCHSEILDEHI